jgi:hypothetical protein
VVRLARVVFNVKNIGALALNCQTLADSSNALGSMGNDKDFELTPVVAHETRSVVVNADCKQVGVEPGMSRGAAGLICLKGKVVT